MPDANHPLNAAALLLGRLLLASLFIIDGWGKIGSYAAAVGYMESFGIPGALLPLVILTEVGCGLCIALGWQARLAALALAGFAISAALIFHHNFAVRNEVLHFQKDLAIAGGFLVLFVFGPGAWSLEGWVSKQP